MPIWSDHEILLEGFGVIIYLAKMDRMHPMHHFPCGTKPKSMKSREYFQHFLQPRTINARRIVVIVERGKFSWE